MKTTYLKGSVQKKAEKGVYSIIASTASIDRQGDSIDQAGWDLTDFKSNPVLLWAHNYSALPIGKVTDIQVVKGKLIADFKFATEDANPMAAQIQKLYEDGIVNASSVGFIPLERNGHVITKASLLELSLVPVPANQDALRLMYEAKSLDSKVFETADSFIKGALEAQISEQDVYEKKWENMDSLSEIISAFYNVYFDENTPVEDFNKLILEMSDLLKKIAGGEEDTDEEKGIIAKNINDTCKKDFLNAILEKSGKRLSKKTLSEIEKAETAAKELLTVLGNLRNEDSQADTQSAEDAEEGVEKEVVKETTASEEVVVIPFADFAKTVQSLIRSSDESNGRALEILNSFLKTKGK